MTDNENSALREKHVPVVENNYTTVQNDNSTTVKEENTLNYEMHSYTLYKKIVNFQINIKSCYKTKIMTFDLLIK